jgi:2-polyprenyl-3-methyl-5-hydroxy-6-metoxy-1,4-benzoquinol methylase
MKDETSQFYDELSSRYDLIYDDWDQAIEWNGRIIDRILTSLADVGGKRLLDCSCGIGTQAIGLARLGYSVTGTDLSKNAISRAKREARSHGVTVDFRRCDMRRLDATLQATYNIVVSCDNALPHLMTTTDLALALKQINSVLSEGGVFLATLRDYDATLSERPSGTPVRRNTKRITFQIWDWQSEDEYQLEHYVIRLDRGKPRCSVSTSRYRAYTRAMISDALSNCGFEDTKWFMPEETDYYQPIVVSRKLRSARE